MSINEAKRDAKFRLSRAGVSYDKVTGRTLSFEDLARANPIFVTIHNPGQGWKNAFNNLPKPSQGGYVVEVR